MRLTSRVDRSDGVGLPQDRVVVTVSLYCLDNRVTVFILSRQQVNDEDTNYGLTGKGSLH